MPKGEHLRRYDDYSPKKAKFSFRLPSHWKIYLYKYFQNQKKSPESFCSVKNKSLRNWVNSFNQRKFPISIEDFKHELKASYPFFPLNPHIPKLDTILTFQLDAEDREVFLNLCLSRPISSYFRVITLWILLINYSYNLII